MFSSHVVGHWIPSDADASHEDGATVAVDPALPASRSLSVLRVAGGPTVVALTPPRASELALDDRDRVPDVELAERIERAGLTLNDPDHLFYLAVDAQAALRDEPRERGTRLLTGDDAAAFAELTAAAPADDLNEAYVELDHWLVFGTFVGDTLACAASTYPWSGTQLADLGVITLPRFRGRGLGRATVRAISAAALSRGYEPQYRCQLDNAASVALAGAAGFTPFGQWQVIDTP